MTDPTDAEIEAVAKAIAVVDDEDGEGCNPWSSLEPYWHGHYRKLARAALTAAAQVREREQGKKASLVQAET